MVSHMHYNLDANKYFVIFFTFKLITCFIDIHLYALGFTSGAADNNCWLGWKNEKRKKEKKQSVEELLGVPNNISYF
jgi:hypothetical protein